MKEKFSKRKKIYIGVLLLFLVLLVSASALFIKAWFSPKAGMLRALQNTASDENVVKLADTVKLLRAETFQSTSELTVSRAEAAGYRNFSYIEGLGLNTRFQVDSSAGNASASSEVSYLMKPYLNVSLYYEPDILAVKLPELFQDAYLSANPARLGQEFNDSGLSAFTGVTLPSDFAVTLFPDKQPKPFSGFDKEWLKQLQVTEEVIGTSPAASFNEDADKCYSVTAPEGSFVLYETDGKITGFYAMVSDGNEYSLHLNGNDIVLSLRSDGCSLDAEGRITSSPKDSEVFSLDMESIAFQDNLVSLKVYGTLSFAPLEHPIRVPYESTIPILEYQFHITDLLSILSLLY